MNEGTDLGNLRLDLCLLLLDLVFCLAGINALLSLALLPLVMVALALSPSSSRVGQLGLGLLFNCCRAALLGKLGKLPVPVVGGPVSAPAACSVSVTYVLYLVVH